MRYWWRGRAALVGCATAVLLAGSFLGADAAPRAWTPVTVPDGSGTLLDAKAFSPNDVWAVGVADYPMGDGTSYSTATVQHWDGTKWSHMRTPYWGAASSFGDVDGVSTMDLWAVGSNNNEHDAALAHWDGQKWTVSAPEKVPNIWLEGVDVIQGNDVWAVGQGSAQSGRNDVIHWDGKQWSDMLLPADFGDVILHDVSAVAPNDVWVAGERTVPDGDYYRTYPVAAHWDGTRWTEVKLPPTPGVGQSSLSSIAAANGQVWIAGQALNKEGIEVGPATFHVDPSGIHSVPAPKDVIPKDLNVSGDTVQMAGTVGTWMHPKPAMMTWQDGKWVPASAPPGAEGTPLYGATTVPGTGQTWAVGRQPRTPADPAYVLTRPYTAHN